MKNVASCAHHASHFPSAEARHRPLLLRLARRARRRIAFARRARRAAVAARASADAAATSRRGRRRTFGTATDRVTLGTSDLSDGHRRGRVGVGRPQRLLGLRLGGRPRQEPRRLQSPPSRAAWTLSTPPRCTASASPRSSSASSSRTQPRTPRSHRRSSPPSSRRSPSASAPRTSPTRSGRPWPAWASGRWRSTCSTGPRLDFRGVTEACNDAFLEGLCLCYEQWFVPRGGRQQLQRRTSRRAAKQFEERGCRSRPTRSSTRWRTERRDGHRRHGRVC